MTIIEAADRLEQTMRDHVSETSRPVSCTDAVRTYQALQETRRQLAHILAGCHANLTGEERELRSLAPRELLQMARNDA